MPLSWNEIRDRAFSFSKRWVDAHDESSHAKPFWIDFFEIFGITDKRVATFEQAVTKFGGAAGDEPGARCGGRSGLRQEGLQVRRRTRCRGTRRCCRRQWRGRAEVRAPAVSEFVLTGHARAEAERRGIPVETVLAVAASPEQVVEGYSGRQVRQSRVEFADGHL